MPLGMFPNMPGPEGKTVTVSIRVPPSIRDKLNQLAKAERRTVSQIVNFMIEEGLERRKAKE